jgi:recombination protein RecR
MTFPSSLIENAVAEFAKLPGVGRKTALRYVLHLLKQDENAVMNFTGLIQQMRSEIQYCSTCNNVSDTDQCGICSSASRQGHTICVVESIRDLLAIEGTQQYNGVYHVLEGLISPLDGIGPEQLKIESLMQRLTSTDVTEVILALSANIQGDTTSYYIQKHLPRPDIMVSTISRGVAFGAELEYTDELTLGRSIQNRLQVGHAV